MPTDSIRSLNSDFSCSFPNKFLIEIGNKCNLKCPGCPTGLGTTDKIEQGMMTYDQFIILLKNIMPFPKKIALFNWGEPFINKDFIKIVQACTERNISTRIDTNLAIKTFSSSFIDEIINSGLVEMSVSIDGITQKNYSKYRVGGDINVVFNNIKGILRAKKKHNSQTPNITWRFLVADYNKHEIDNAQLIADKLGIPIIYSPFSFWKNNNDGILVELSKLNDDLSLKRKHQFPKHLDFRTHPFLHQSHCRQPFNLFVINWNGEVFPCCQISKGKGIGNIFESSIKDIWNNTQFKEVRNYLYNYGSNDIDSYCTKAQCTVGIKNTENIAKKIVGKGKKFAKIM
jgi:radical SAM protein with 4Fe4S-binding SPASM domain